MGDGPPNGITIGETVGIAMIGNGTHSGVKGRRIKGNVTDLLLLKGAKKLVSTANLQLNLHVKTNGAHLNVKTRKIPGLNPVIGTGG